MASRCFFSAPFVALVFSFDSFFSSSVALHLRAVNEGSPGTEDALLSQPFAEAANRLVLSPSPPYTSFLQKGLFGKGRKGKGKETGEQGASLFVDSPASGSGLPCADRAERELAEGLEDEPPSPDPSVPFKILGGAPEGPDSGSALLGRSRSGKGSVRVPQVLLTPRMQTESREQPTGDRTIPAPHKIPIHRRRYEAPPAVQPGVPGGSQEEAILAAIVGPKPPAAPLRRPRTADRRQTHSDGSFPESPAGTPPISPTFDEAKQKLAALLGGSGASSSVSGTPGRQQTEARSASAPGTPRRPRPDRPRLPSDFLGPPPPPPSHAPSRQGTP